MLKCVLSVFEDLYVVFNVFWVSSACFECILCFQRVLNILSIFYVPKCGVEVCLSA